MLCSSHRTAEVNRHFLLVIHFGEVLLSLYRHFCSRDAMDIAGLSSSKIADLFEVHITTTTPLLLRYYCYYFLQ